MICTLVHCMNDYGAGASDLLPCGVDDRTEDVAGSDPLGSKAASPENLFTDPRLAYMITRESCGSKVPRSRSFVGVFVLTEKMHG